LPGRSPSDVVLFDEPTTGLDPVTAPSSTADDPNADVL
jgi:ABC-type transporter Mla maintaining outer membrane lipid asymmetry ATPase subunit MlaF